MNNMRLFKKSLLAVTVTLATQQAFAAASSTHNLLPA